MHAAQMPGFGDAATWPACTGHPLDPRTEADDDLLTEDEAREIAREELEADAYAFAWWLNNDAGIEVCKGIRLQQLRDAVEEGRELTNTELLRAFMGDHGWLGTMAKFALLERFMKAPQTVALIAGRAAELLAAQDEGAHFDRMARYHLEAA